jgi:hypothetical protein
MMASTTVFKVLRALAILGAAAVLIYCVDPVPDHLVKAQGAELDGYPQGEFHRPGEVCGACHRENGTADTVFRVAGTIFAGPDSLTGVDNAEVQLTDSVGTQYIAKTNCVGNFWVTPDDWDPKFPILVRVHKGQTALQMKGQISRESSCGACHLNHKLDDSELHSRKPHIALFGGDEPPGGPVSDASCTADAHIPGYDNGDQ